LMADQVAVVVFHLVVSGNQLVELTPLGAAHHREESHRDHEEHDEDNHDTDHEARCLNSQRTQAPTATAIPTAATR
jgi:ABC-type Zn2+ transport system substrate-binding protein/surface adhesin